MSPILEFPAIWSIALASLLAILAFVSHRTGIQDLASWMLAWACLLIACATMFVAREIPALQPAGYSFSSMAPVLMLIGARLHAGRSVPASLFGLGFMVAVCRLVLFQLGHPEAPGFVSAIFDPALGLSAAFVIFQRSPAAPGPRPRTDLALVIGLVAYAGVEAADALARTQGFLPTWVWAAWGIVAVSLFTFQVTPQLARLGRQAREHEHQARSDARRLQLLTGDSQDAIIECDARGMILFATPNLTSLAQRSPDDLIGRNVSEFLGPESESAILRPLRQKGRLEEADVMGAPPERVFVPTCDGRERWFESSWITHRSDEGDLRIVIRTRNVTERILLERAIQTGNERFRLLVDSNIVSVFHVDSSGMIQEANDAFLSLVGRTREELPLAWRKLAVPTDPSDPTGPKKDPMDMLDEAGESGNAVPYEQDLLSASGERLSTLLGRVRLPEGTTLFIAVDQSDRKRAEQLIAQRQQELEEAVAQRTLELVASRSKLIEAERLAAAGTLAAGVAHQINNPIGAILNGAEYALLCRDDDDASETFERALRDILSEARRCARIVRSMLQFSRGEPTQKWREALNDVVRRAHHAVAAHATDRSASVRVEIPDEPIYAHVNPIEIEQALVNILCNAIESRDVGARVSLSLTAREDLARIEVRDDGRGIPEADREHLFEPFFSTRSREGGTGLGLSVAHGVVADHQGSLRIETEPGGGTRVCVTIPRLPSDPDGRSPGGFGEEKTGEGMAGETLGGMAGIRGNRSCH